MNALVGRGQQLLQAEFARTLVVAASLGPAQQLDAGVARQLQPVMTVKSKQRRVHHFENASQKSRGLERTDALLLQQIGERVDLGGQFAQRVL